MIRSIRFLLIILSILTFLMLLSVKPITSNEQTSSKEVINNVNARQIKTAKIGESLNRLYRIIQSFERDSKSINLDGLYGIRIAEGVIMQLDKETNNFSNLDSNLNDKIKVTIKVLKKRIHTLTESIINSVKKQSVSYFNEFKPLIDKPYLQEPILRNHKNNFNVSNNATVKNLSFNEKLSDHCLSLLMNSEPEHYGKCVTSTLCFNIILQEDSAEYSLTHQLLYFMIAEHIGCIDKVIGDLLKHIKNYKLYKLASQIFLQENSNNIVDIKDRSVLYEIKTRLFGYFCSRIYHESSNLYTEIKKSNWFPIDLFLEQNVLCGMLGMDEVYNEKYFNEISSYQQSTGCFGGDINVYGKLEGLKSLDGIIQEINNKPEYQRTKSKRYIHRIVKRNDMEMLDDCSAHETGLAIAYFSIYLSASLNH